MKNFLRLDETPGKFYCSASTTDISRLQRLRINCSMLTTHHTHILLFIPWCKETGALFTGYSSPVKCRDHAECRFMTPQELTDCRLCICGTEHCFLVKEGRIDFWKVKKANRRSEVFLSISYCIPMFSLGFRLRVVTNQPYLNCLDRSKCLIFKHLPLTLNRQLQKMATSLKSQVYQQYILV